MRYFCEQCSNLLVKITTDVTFMYKCEQCNETYQPKPSDTQLYEDKKDSNVSMTTILQNAAKDEMNPRAYVKCPKCPNNIVVQVRIGKNMDLINICIKCDNKFSEASRSFNE